LLIITVDYRDDVGSFSIATKRAKTTSVDIEFYTIGNGIGARKKSGKVGSRSTAGGVMVQNVRRYTGFHRARYKKSSALLS
jgi:dihydroxyacetone kinase